MKFHQQDPLVHVTESDSDTAWQDFQDSVAVIDRQYADTVPAPLMPEVVSSTAPTVLITPDEDPFK